ncbi:hypothetical protein [Spirosoma utsteinense]|uniref:Uncharacterized protein n=1 Tax=Spirosoma utsteinense TaxID=2585773 RepID=A0ABR6WF92_9BACT|nr:hypothetical protein [Spirosoma utsteinense]MBC3795201.1 hypothetical protein [Spirosoma utsteinense]
MKLNLIVWLSISLLLVLVSSCAEDQLPFEDRSVSESRTARIALSDDESTELKREFATALAKALKESQSLRNLLKIKSLEMIDEDYDVLYQLIKNEKIENDLSVKELITKHIKNKGKLQVIEAKLPTLTIFVPDLPMGSFSAQSWDVEQQIPRVGVKLNKSNDVPIIDADGKEFVLEGKYMPGFPVVVVKESLRIIERSHPMYGKRITKNKISTSDGLEFQFIDDAFDRKLNLHKKGARAGAASTFDSKVINAYNIFLNTGNWHRDHIYYDLTNTQDKGAFNPDFEETITTFSMGDDPVGSYNRIADQTDDPHVQGSSSTVQNSFWTSGSFSFKVKILVNGRNGVGSEILKYFPVSPSQLFHVGYTRRDGGNPYYFPRIDYSKEVRLNIPVFKWDLNQYSTSIKISVEEEDFNTTTQLSESTVSTFAANFSIDGGVLKKIGLKFGASNQTQNTVSYTKSYTQGNDELGDAIVNFYDDVITQYEPNTIVGPAYSSKVFSGGGYYYITLEPMRAQ